MKLALADIKAFLSKMESDEPAAPPIYINITLPDMAASMQRMFGTPDGESLRTRESVVPSP